MKTMFGWMALALVAALPLQAKTPELEARVLGQGDPVLLLPGLGCPGRVWDELAQSLSREREVHVLEIPGFAGQAPLARDGALVPALADAVDGYVEAHELERPALIGHSFGGFLATRLATRSPQRYGRVIAVDGVPFYSALFDPKASAESARPLAAQFRGGVLAQPQQAFAAQQVGILASMMRDGATAAALATATAQSDRATFADAMFELMTTDLRPELARLEQPMLLIGALGGFADDASKQAAAAVYRAQIDGQPQVRLALAENARHFVQYDDPRWLESTVHAFLADRSEETAR
jgi:pimeloyl-ACP methyl ester carboxylesterase